MRPSALEGIRWLGGCGSIQIVYGQHGGIVHGLFMRMLFASIIQQPCASRLCDVIASFRFLCFIAIEERSSIRKRSPPVSR